MGSHTSRSDSEDEEPVRRRIVLESNDIEGVAKYMKSAECKRVFVMVGAGLSVAAGIPDFRSPETGLYANLEKFDLPYPEAIFELGFFRERPEAFYAFAKDFDPSVFRPTLSHSFLHLLEKKRALHTCFTQNIDGLERRAGISEEKLVEAHGTIATAHCVECHTEYDNTKLWNEIRNGNIARCDHCEGIAKPDIVFFGEALPARFASSAPSLKSADLLIILGTSLKVWPFAGLTRFVGSNCPRVLINLEEAGDIGTHLNDVVCLGKCDDIVRELCGLLGWEQELDVEWATTHADRIVPGKSVAELQTQTAAEGQKRAKANGGEAAARIADRLSDHQVDKLADVIALQLELADKKEDTEEQKRSEAKEIVSKAKEKLDRDDVGITDDEKPGKL